MLFGDDSDNPSTSSDPCTPKSHGRSYVESSGDDDDDFWM
jgi:hypothetical protein